MLNSHAFDYINVLDKAADASWKRETVLANNIANVDTPGYKRKDIEFQKVLDKKLFNSKYTNLDQAIKDIDTTELNPIEYYDYPGFSYREDQNNVDIDTENVELASETIRYQALTTSMKQEFNLFKTVTKKA